MRTSILLALLIFPIATDARAQAQDRAVPDIASMLTAPDEANGRRPPNATPGSSDKRVGPTRESKSLGPTREGRVAGAKRSPGELAPEPTAGSKGRQGVHPLTATPILEGQGGGTPRSPNQTPRSPKSVDPPVRRAQAGADTGSIPPDIPIPSPAAIDNAAASSLGGQSISMEAALYGAITSNPDLVTLRNSNLASPEAVEVARRFPTTLNPTLWVDVRPFVDERIPGGVGANGRYRGPGIDHKDALMYFSLRQPIELGHQTKYRYEIAKAAYTQQQWTVVQAELLALVQTYRFYQTSAYRRERFRVAQDLAKFNDQLAAQLKKRLEANQVAAADVVLAEVESEATRQLVEVARQEYANALTDLRNQIGTPETAADAEPLGEFALPGTIPQIENQAMIELALQSRPEIRAAMAQVEGARAAVCLAKGDRIPTPVVGPVYERDEQGTQFFGFVYITPIPIINNGSPLVRQREAEYRRTLVTLQQVRQRTVAQVKAATAKWNGASRLIRQSTGLTDSLKSQVGRIEQLFEANQTDLSKLLQARQRLIQLETSELDALWQATQAQADLLTALGAPTLIAALQKQSAVAPTQPEAVPVPKP